VLTTVFVHDFIVVHDTVVDSVAVVVVVAVILMIVFTDVNFERIFGGLPVGFGEKSP